MTNKVVWNEVNCSQLNGRFIEYNILIKNIYVNELVFGTVYNISVAAVNSVGRGPFSDSILVKIGESIVIITYVFIFVCYSYNEQCFIQ